MKSLTLNIPSLWDSQHWFHSLTHLWHTSTMRYFTGQLDWTKRWQTLHKTLFLGMSVRVIWKEMSTGIIDWVKKIPSPMQMGSSNPLRAWIAQKGEGRVNYSPWLSWHTHLLLPPDIRAPGSWAFGPKLGFTLQAPLCPFSGLWTQTELYPSFPSSPSYTWHMGELFSCLNHISQFP